MDILNIKLCLYVSNFINFNTKHYFYESYATLLSMPYFSCISLCNNFSDAF